ncbi:dolichyl-phosphate-mannose--protein mannosyltransferase [Clostridium chromiireducens]|uniref:Dolichyl-phosphate-mannose--protein mannosyltransferase n=1 Tax=Clostridium chromiireducens TaxID=225345 RepID=A0A964RST0_9CLOT|nr:glycosyltransferase family 39 protein [Clostridium chromiireducens]MVX67070.1 dolichyl-phosphate-mannose--protein mannosyltransferase [Clostridium chromiireducens]
MKRFKLTKENICITLILILSAVLNFANIGIEGYGNGYYAAGVKSMTLSLKNFFFVSFDPGSFVTIDKPPMGFWIQAIFAKIFGFSGWSILLPQAIAGVISVYLIYYIVKRSFGSVAGLISALCLAITPVFVAASRNNTIDNLLVVTLLFACLALTKAVEAGKAKYLYISLLLVGIGFNIKMLEAYMIGPALYITYLLSATIPFKKRIGHLVIGSVILLAVSLSWAVIVDLVPAQNRPYVGSSTNNSELELIIGHNGLERLGLSGNSGGGPGGRSNNADNNGNKTSQGAPDGDNKGSMSSGTQNDDQQVGMSSGGPNGDEMGGQGAPTDGTMQGDGNGRDRGNMQPPSGGMIDGGGPGGQGGLQGTFGAQVSAGLSRLFVKSSLSDQIVWFLPLALLGFIAGALKEKLGVKLDNKRKSSLVLWFVWLFPEFIYFSFTTGLFHPYYLTMMAPPAAALSGIGITTMWEFYKEGKWKAWLLPIAFVIEGLTHLMMLSYFTSNLSAATRNIILISLVVCFAASAILSILNISTFIKRNDTVAVAKDNFNKNIKLKKALTVIATISILVTPFIGASAALIHSVNSSIPTAGLELLSNSQGEGFGSRGEGLSSENSKLIDFLKSNKTTEKYLLVVPSSQSADSIIIQTGEPVMALGGFTSDNILTLDQFKEMVKNGELRYVLTGGMGRGGNSEIMNWVTENGTAVPESEYKDTAVSNQQSNKNSQAADENNDYNSNSRKQNQEGFGGNNSGQLYDLKAVADTLK